ncbi:hypothetical protein HPB47_006679 [Ixodes persulcatus]|uniref:Uncharacterized protein n=1 Tax=Ixodes persulcatus TaxID=34615 RepID=A0AC60PA83_IXOPE|nr:hypothetical protein HPB47_006679 [Ixodes persulcatus]
MFLNQPPYDVNVAVSGCTGVSEVRQHHVQSFGAGCTLAARLERSAGRSGHGRVVELNLFGVGLKTVGVSFRVLSVPIARRVVVRRGWFRFPETPSERYDVETDLRSLGRIFGVISCVNETMIAIVGPSKNDPTATVVVYCAASISMPST